MAKSNIEKYVYSFGGGKADGNESMKNLLGGKGANLAEMAGHKMERTVNARSNVHIPIQENLCSLL